MCWMFELHRDDAADDGDAIAMMIHQDRAACEQLLADAGAVPATPEQITGRARAATVGPGS